MRRFVQCAAWLGLLVVGKGFADTNNVAEKHFYDELGCQASGTGEQLTYDCSNLQTRDQTKCYFRGQEFVPDPENSGESFPGSCLVACHCTPPDPVFKGTSVPTVTCAQQECPELFNSKLIPRGCKKTYDQDTCCNTGIICDPNSPDLHSESASRAYEWHNYTDSTYRCSYNNETYLENTKFYPEDAPCKVCYCRQGFDGTLKEPYCRDVTCGYELHYAQRLKDGCAPVRLENRPCCPIDWRCPQGSDSVVPSTNSSADNSGTCKWGSLTLKRGDALSAPESEACMKCTCNVPPMVSCEKPPSC